ncbi:hypothetical protein Rsub_00185 [Raphidocelis subcapitata]|uniref:Uncharacterized protein n=1 Tax=Raphidocelis subcapitata TaxID=307507 RepID=A0A2V0NJQ8_9CHLO|nr:hypothetical protein Rsub_00185 [Raphidocelis subcapitata]|eukprot:GBF87474.1 hypothetical protein Rsub_00185 [Raphidocelis subcapitata]
MRATSRAAVVLWRCALTRAHCCGLAVGPAALSASSSATAAGQPQLRQRRAASGAASPPARPAITKLLVANRGEISCRVLATARRLGIPTVAVFSEADRRARHVALADEAYCIGPPPAAESYLDADAVLAAAADAGADAIHPGYGFLSENAPFAEACASAGIRFVGPPPAAIRSMGDKSEAKGVMSEAGVPVVPGYHGEDQRPARLADEAAAVGFPLLVKAVAGGGGKGMKIARSMSELPAALDSARREALASFGDGRLLLERLITRPRHVEVQVIADAHGGALYLFDRDCSVQRRHQKIIEEAPAPGLSQELHAHLGEAAVRAARAVGYVNAGTVEFIFDCDSGEYYFMEMNTRLQVEHPVTEAVTGLDLVELQLRVAAGEKLPLSQQQLGAPRGHAFEARLYAESPARGFLPCGGRVRRWRVPPAAAAFDPAAALRVDSGVAEGDEVGTFYDPMVAKIVARGEDRAAALRALRGALAGTQVAGLPTNLGFLRRLAGHAAFEGLELDTGFIERHRSELLAPEPVPLELAALAAVARCKLQAARAAAATAAAGGAAAAGPWAMADAKRLWLPHARPLEMEAGEGGGEAAALAVTYLSDSEFEVSGCSPAGPLRVSHVALALEPDAASPPDQTAARVSAQIAGRRVSADALLYSRPSEEVLALWTAAGEAREFRWPVARWSKAAAAGAPAGGAVATPMPGKLIKLLVEEGEAVSAGQPLLVLESMKMENTVASPRAGRVRLGTGLHAGAQVEEGQVLLHVVAAEEERRGGGAEGAPAQAAAAGAEAA